MSFNVKRWFKLFVRQLISSFTIGFFMQKKMIKVARKHGWNRYARFLAWNWTKKGIIVNVVAIAVSTAATEAMIASLEDAA